ncbi:RNA-directed DNA polymerase, eukaryota [Tanacetum coccineum]
MIFKVDFAKAYDSVRWDFLDDVLSSFGFGSRWRSWVRGSLSSGKASILVNGSPTSEFHFYRGLKQGDPLAPFLFLLIMEALHLSFSRALEAGIFSGYKIDSSTTLSHLFYADDAVFIGEWSHSNLRGIMNILRCFSFLSGNNMSSIKAWDEIVAKMKKRLSRWKLNSLSVGGRLTLLKSVLCSTPIYNMSIFKKDVLGSSGLRCIASKKFGGVGSNLLLRSNLAPSSKGTCTSFWNDLWIGDSMLKLSFPRLFALEENKVISVADKLHSSISSSFRRPVRGGEEAQQLDQLSVILDSVSLSNMDDRWYWDLNGDGVFLVKDVRSLLDEVFLPKMDAPTRWIKCIPIKVNVFVWKLSLDRLPTRSNLLSRNILVSDVACPLCDHELEDSSHLFFGCPIAKDVQKLVCRWWNLDVQPYESYDGWLSWFKSIRFGSKTKDVLKGVFYVSWWSIWYFRNQLLFSDSIPRKDAIFDDIILRSFNWCVARSSKVLNWVSWLQYPYLIPM